MTLKAALGCKTLPLAITPIYCICISSSRTLPLKITPIYCISISTITISKLPATNIKLMDWLVSKLVLWAQSTTKNYTRAKTSVCLLFTLHTSYQTTNSLKTTKSVLTLIYIRQNRQKHQTQFFHRISTFGIANWWMHTFQANNAESDTEDTFGFTNTCQEAKKLEDARGIAHLKVSSNTENNFKKLQQSVQALSVSSLSWPSTDQLNSKVCTVQVCATAFT